MFTGGCQCGKVRYQLTAPPFAVVACHCTECQRQSGSAFAMSLIVSRDACSCSAEESIASFHRPADSGRQVRCMFCKHCGTRILHDPDYDVPVLNVRAGTLDDTSELRPVAHTWLRSKQPWVYIPEDVLRYQEQPSTAQFVSDLEAVGSS